ncbi:hypothetical protein CP03DC35_1071 [Chlamydia psittaci 03DC35]|nr:hypothetical protein CP02DC22_1084 [Chlamydia psittaci 02DC22]EPJ18717.1 hypothetical protein CP01DC11_0353 [Chlamydia psittaci 01DC11]EPJ20646.1 hypothetical protein CP02DC23_0349 [Chlamydia psittaci 02DC23]EPJ22105.1 hypothetical protein CP03DC29_0784 [Chlamydia psittaci 03DC29]EPJ23982.1 hypothetical protein CP08DC60_0596 [Chlamydia psittaci 08DC60]EPJ29215.1 hypothetical protein CPC1998_0356 [Chlamydia psittaci C19/98]EPJ29548.1 hypothetical protein CP09DC78_1078 [Chlamydia psittaci 09
MVMGFVSNFSVAANGLGKIDLSKDAIPAFNKNENLCSHVTRVAIAALVAIVAVASLIVGCMSCSVGGTAAYCGVVTIATSLVGLAWSAIALKRMFIKG